MTSSRQMLCVTLCALLVAHVGAFSLPASGPLGLRKHAARRVGGSHVRMQTGEGFEDDIVFARVNARMDLEPMQLVLAYMEHALESEPAVRPCDLLEAAFAAGAAEPQKPDDSATPMPRSDPPTLPPIGLGDFSPAPLAAAPEPEDDANAKNDIVPFAPAGAQEGEDAASVLARANSMARLSMPTPDSKDVRGNPFFHVKNNVMPFSSPQTGLSEDAASVLERANKMLAENGPIDAAPSDKSKPWAREHTLLSACAWERKMVTEAIIGDLGFNPGGNTTLSQPE
jgi:hypothetical protein